ncbi:predicted protein [Uncinocarpus reesii 1704]|uniref:Uncharacterized protein n=1 Tax=Uncinocarpus reesii (strain UAMH 1704) TaxID=336963 RepID=C4JG67_UNCRE|nr:uncharacterized protein UREG_02465 [Uncinocarpus reesii 1704]EEP77616.1 predicted protein [Uncinocarpus reesii 1704]
MEDILRELSEIKGQIGMLEKQSGALDEKYTALEERSMSLEEKYKMLEERSMSLEEKYKMLEERSMSLREKTSVLDNHIAGGGDILGDIMTIQYCQEQQLPYVAEYKEDFQKAYRIAFDKALIEAPSYPPEVIRAFDIWASVHELSAWQAHDNKATREDIKKQAAGIIDAALSTEKNQLEARLGNGGDLRVAFDTMVRLFTAGR